MSSRPLSDGETRLANSVFGDALDYKKVRIAQRKFAFFQPANIVMAPRGTIHFHPECTAYCSDFASAAIALRALFIHELVHVWQHQQGVNLILRRHPFCRYDYAIKPGQPFRKYGLEQQAMLVEHAFLLREGAHIPGAPSLAQYRSILPFDFSEHPYKLI